MLSIGLVADDGAELYIEIADKKIWAESSKFVIKTVLPQFGLVGHSVSTNAELGQLMGSWFDQLQSGKQINIAYDYHADFDLLEQALRDAGLWDRFEKILVPNHIGYMLGHELVEGAMDHSWMMSRLNRGIERHHALADAIALRCGFDMMHGGS
jgi:hypothetical protein